MRSNNNNKRSSKSNKNMSNKDIAKALKERDKNSQNNGESYNNKDSVTGDRRFNDPDWYINSEQILNDAARIPYSIPVGTCFNRDGRITVGSDVILNGYDNAIPGILASYLMPTLGPTNQSPSAAVNVASNSLFQFVRSKISGTRHYEAVDMMIYMGAMDSLYCMITWLTRLYGTVYTYHQANKYMSRALIEAQGVDYDDLVSNLPQFRTMLNIELAKVRAMYLPAVLPIFKRHSWMFSHYFIEGESEKDQIYFHVPAGFHYFDVDDSGAGALVGVCTCHNTTKWTVSYLIQMIRRMIDAIFEREDFNIISGDLLKAYEGNVFTLTEIPDIVTINLTYSPEVLLQFKNAKYKNIPNVSEQNPQSWMSGFFSYFQNGTHHLEMVGSTPSGRTTLRNSFMALDSNDNKLYYFTDPTDATGSIQATMYEWSKDTLLTTPSRDVQPVENMINTRLSLGFQFMEDTSVPVIGYTYRDCYFGSEWPVFYRLYAYHRNKANGNITLFSRTYDRVLMALTDISVNWTNSQEPIRSAYQYLPEMSMIIKPTPTTAQIPGRSIFQVDNYALISPETLNGMHTAAILGEYNIPNLSVGR